MAEENKPEENKEKVGFFKKLGNKFNDATYDIRLQSEFGRTHKKYGVYSGSSVLSVSPEIAVEEHLDEGYVVTIDDDEIPQDALIRNEESGEVFHIDGVEKTTLTVEFEGKSNEKPALKITLGAPAEKVEVIKVGTDFYLK